ncbi:hypothetical protein HK405_009180, partial [Cladochytrium tenue]
PVAQSDSVHGSGAWYDRPNGDTPAAINARAQVNLSLFQSDIDLSGVNKPLTAPNYTTQFLEHLVDTGTNAVAFLTVYPYQGLENVTGSWFVFGQDPVKFIEGWKRFYTFVKSGMGAYADKVAIVWSPNSRHGYPFLGGDYSPNVTKTPSDQTRLDELDWNKDGEFDANDDPFQPFYPGDDYVDWVGLSIYQYGPNGCNVSTGNKPFIVSETAVAYHYGWGENATEYDKSTYTLDTSISRTAMKQAWWRQLLSTDLLAKYPRLRAICTFEFLKDEEVTLRDYTSLGAPPNGLPEDADVVAAFISDVAKGSYGTVVSWASPASPVTTSSTSASATATTTTKATTSAAGARFRSGLLFEGLVLIAIVLQATMILTMLS